MNLMCTNNEIVENNVVDFSGRSENFWKILEFVSKLDKQEIDVLKNVLDMKDGDVYLLDGVRAVVCTNNVVEE